MSDDGFLSRWARRKAEVRAGRPVSEPPQRPDEAARGPAADQARGAGPAPSREAPVGAGPELRPGERPAAATGAAPVATPGATAARHVEARATLTPGALPQPPGAAVQPAVAGGSPSAPSGAPSMPADEPPPTLEDAARLAPGADVSRFVRRGVDASVQRTALKRLFADPHFNIMDGLDVYIDDYGKPDPIPEAMLRQMNQSQFLGLFEDTQTAQTGEAANLTGAAEHRRDPGENAAQDPADRDAPARGSSDTETAQDTQTAQDTNPPQALARDLPRDLCAPSSPAHDAPAPDAAAADPAAMQPNAHEDPDLQLQPDDPAGWPGPEERAGTRRP